MFRQLTRKRERALHNMGFLSLRLRQMHPTGERFVRVPHKICYVSEEDGSVPFTLFDCEITHTAHMFMVSQLRKTGNTMYEMNEPSLHFFLGLALATAPKWARNANRDRLLVETALPHCTEHFAEYGYNIRVATARQHGELVYRGLRSVKDA